MSYIVEIMHTTPTGTIVSFRDEIDVKNNFRGRVYNYPRLEHLYRLERAIKKSCYTWIEFDGFLPVIKSRINHCPTCGDGLYDGQEPQEYDGEEQGWDTPGGF